MGAAVVATEDSRFYQHDGIDAVGVPRAARSALTRSAIPGGATLDVQLAAGLRVKLVENNASPVGPQGVADPARHSPAAARSSPP